MGKYLSKELEDCKRQNCDVSTTICELYSLERKVIHKLEEQASKLYITALHDECLPIVCAVQNTQKILLKVESATRDEVRKKVHEALRGNYLEELVNLLTENLSNALESSTIGAEERSLKYVVFANKSVLRVDIFVYYEALTSCEALAEYKNILAYYMQVGLLDMAKTRPQVLTYELTRATEEDKLKPKADISYHMTIKTGDKPNAGTDAIVYFSLHGNKGETPRIVLQDESQTFTRFERARADKFIVQTADVGKLEKLIIGHDNTGQDPAWFLDEVDVDIPVRYEHYKFRFGGWLGGSQPGRRKEVVLFKDSWIYGQFVIEKLPDIPDLIDYMQSGDEVKIINAARYLQHLCYSNETVKGKVRELRGIPVIIRLLKHSEWRVRYAAICLLKNLSFSMTHDANKLDIAYSGGIEALIEILQETEKTEYKEAILVVLCNLSSIDRRHESLRLYILLSCLHIIVIIIIIPYSEWTAVAARGQPVARSQPWPVVLVHATRLVRNLSSAGTRARRELRDEKDLVDCLVWIIRVGVKSEHYDNKCLEHSVCTLRNLSYRLESEIDRDRYDDPDIAVDPAAVKEQQSQGCFAGCGGRKKKKVPNANRPMDQSKGPPQGVELIWQPQTVQQYYVLLRKAKNIETLEGSAGALHNLTACSGKWAIKIRGDTRKAQAIPQLVELLRIDYDPTIRAAAIALRNLCVDPENKRAVGEKAVVHLVHRLPTGEKEMQRLVQDPTVASLLCTIHQLANKNEKNSKFLRKTTGIRKMVRIATDQDKTYSARVIKIANQVLANLWSDSQLQQQMKHEGWQYDATRNAEVA